MIQYCHLPRPRRWNAILDGFKLSPRNYFTYSEDLPTSVPAPNVQPGKPYQDSLTPREGGPQIAQPVAGKATARSQCADLVTKDGGFESYQAQTGQHV